MDANCQDIHADGDYVAYMAKDGQLVGIYKPNAQGGGIMCGGVVTRQKEK